MTRSKSRKCPNSKIRRKVEPKRRDVEGVVSTTAEDDMEHWDDKDSKIPPRAIDTTEKDSPQKRLQLLTRKPLRGSPKRPKKVKGLRKDASDHMDQVPLSDNEDDERKLLQDDAKENNSPSRGKSPLEPDDIDEPAQDGGEMEVECTQNVSVVDLGSHVELPDTDVPLHDVEMNPVSEKESTGERGAVTHTDEDDIPRCDGQDAIPCSNSVGEPLEVNATDLQEDDMEEPEPSQSQGDIEVPLLTHINSQTEDKGDHQEHAANDPKSQNLESLTSTSNDRSKEYQKGLLGYNIMMGIDVSPDDMVEYGALRKWQMGKVEGGQIHEEKKVERKHPTKNGKWWHTEDFSWECIAEWPINRGKGKRKRGPMGGEKDKTSDKEQEPADKRQKIMNLNKETEDEDIVTEAFIGLACLFRKTANVNEENDKDVAFPDEGTATEEFVGLACLIRTMDVNEETDDDVALPDEGKDTEEAFIGLACLIRTNEEFDDDVASSDEGTNTEDFIGLACLIPTMK